MDMKFGIGQSVPRVEDRRFVTGQGRYVADLVGPTCLHARFLRSDRAHALITKIATEDAAGMPGVQAVLTGEDAKLAGLGGISCHTLFPGLHTVRNATVAPALAQDRVLFVGMPVAMVVADTPEEALDAVEAIVVDYDDLAVLTTPDDALGSEATRLWPGSKDNVAFEIRLGDHASTDRALSHAAHVTELQLWNNRLTANSLETRGILARWDLRDRRLQIHASTQSPHTLRGGIAAALGLSQTDVRVIAEDVGGGFGMKGALYPEDILVGWAAHRLKGSVAWQANRSEALLSDFHGRDQHVTARLGLDETGRITALQVECDYNTGAYLAPAAGVPAMCATTLATGCYRVPVAAATARAVFTNTTPTHPYRGAGRPEAAFLIERLVDKAARETGRDRVELRLLNLVTTAEMPYQTPLVYTLDSGDFGAVLNEAARRASLDGVADRKREAQSRGKLRGIGIALHMESAGQANEKAEIRFDPGGTVSVHVGTFNHGQGHDTVFAQIVHSALSVPFEDIRIVQGDTDAVRFGRGTVASRSMVNGGGSLQLAADEVIENARRIAAHAMEVDMGDVAFENGVLSVEGTDKRMSIQEVARLSFQPRLAPELGLGLSGEGDFRLAGATFPNGCQIVEVEVDPETGETTLLNLVSVDDVGTVINPMLLDGQMMGGIAQGIGQALMEGVTYDATGEPLTGSFMDYAMPRADDIPKMEIALLPTRTDTNPLGVKGAGEAGTVGATPAVISAILDALAPLGVEDVPMPATPCAIWTSIQKTLHRS